MSSEFTVYPEKLKGNAQDIIGLNQSVTNANQKLNDICNNIRRNGAYNDIIAVLRSILAENENIAQNINELGQILQDIANAYDTTEKAISDGKVGEVSISQGENETSENEEGAWEFIKDALWQALAGDFEEDSNWLGVLLNVIIGFIPYLGQVADARDLVADVIHLVDDGPTTEEWVALGFTVVGIIPGIGDFLKHADELGPVLKHLDDISEGLGEMVQGVLKHGDEVYSSMEETIEGFTRNFDDKVMSKISSKIDDILQEAPNASEAIEKLKEFLGKKINSKGDDIGDFLKECITEISGLSDGIQDWVTDTIDSIFDTQEVGAAHISNNGFVSIVA